MRRHHFLLVALVLLTVLALPAAAFAFDEPHSQPETVSPGGPTNHGEVGRRCTDCHRTETAGGGYCTICHPFHGIIRPEMGKGPHGLYSAASDRCDACHGVHAAAGPKLLPGATVKDSCFTCHDGTGGQGVYGAIAARGIAVGQAHRIDATNVVPGGNPASGSEATMAFSGIGGTLGCDDCHSPHDASTIASFTIERRRTASKDDVARNGVKTNRLLRRNPGGSTATATVYGSDWCGACHKGRLSGGAVHNHPADSTASTGSPFCYERAAVLTTDGPGSATTTGAMAGWNRGYLMPYPRTAQQRGHAPICQQCHEDSRYVGSLNTTGDVADPATFTITASDGNVASDNPRFQSFPHETVNQHFLVEANDDLCTNCHPPDALP